MVEEEVWGIIRAAWALEQASACQEWSQAATSPDYRAFNPFSSPRQSTRQGQTNKQGPQSPHCCPS